MFEKEAEDNKPPYAYCAIDTNCELWKDGFQKGAKFGYNKGKKELEQKYSKQADDFENMKAGLESEITELKEENTELKAQIGKMKCCSNCSKVYVRKEDGLVCCSVGSFHINAYGKDCKEWELREIKGND